MRFIGRDFELNELNKEYKQDKFSFSVIYGRRRVGKTYLIKEFLKGKEGYYFVSLESNELINLSLISQAIYKACGNISGLPDFNSFDSAFKFLFEYSVKNKIIFVIDEYPYLADSSPYISSLIQNLIDQYKEKSKMFLILCGSSMSFMEEQVLGYKSPLYGRRTSQYKIQPFNYLESSEFVPNYSYKKKAIVYGLTNGIAEYLTYFDNDKSLKDNIIDIFLKTNGRLYEETTNLLKQELRQPKTYNDIIFAISQGSTKLNEIATKLGVASGSLNHYLKSLIELGIIEKKTPVLDRKTKRPLYIIKDTMFLFWYLFVQPNLNMINLDLGEKVYDNYVDCAINEFMGKIFEKISIEYFEEKLKRSETPFIPKDYGNWWGNDKRLKKESEIDMIAYDKENSYLFLEAKWRNELVNQKVLDNLIEKSLNFSFSSASYWITSLSGFNDVHSSKDIKLISLEEMYKLSN
ncbi:ATP-binding protein [Helcococcus kunzii]|uniref:ATP-binding protein n=1 Tax=Helcococcus kunzii TaxID=40091 RepID=UPI0024ACC662|nr:ATP-binding protein [Helcococcus kunzii]